MQFAPFGISTLPAVDGTGNALQQLLGLGKSNSDLGFNRLQSSYAVKNLGVSGAGHPPHREQRIEMSVASWLSIELLSLTVSGVSGLPDDQPHNSKPARLS
jgi:hypothetical protein